VYYKLLNHTRATALQSEATKYLFYDQSIDTEDSWSADLFLKKVQSSGDLGQRMEDAFKSVLSSNSKAVIVGSDCPEITSELIDEAFRR